MSYIYRYVDGSLDFHHSIDKKPCPDNFPMHAHEMYELLFFLSGNGRFMVEGCEYALEPGNLMLMRPSEAHKLKIQPDSPYERVAVHFSSDVVGGVDPKGELLRPFNDRPLGRQNLYQRSSFRSGYVHECLNSMETDINDNYYRRLSIATNLYPILTELREAFLFRQNESLQNPHNEMSHELVSYVNYNLTSGDLSLDKLSEQFLISKCQLNRIFKQATGSTVWDYILIKRVMTARQMLRSGQPAHKVSQECGFRDYSSFYRFYKKRFNVSPQEDRFKV
ncbi:MAG: AraC family transcriptional regulator [Oscillospiraceae bacterium]|jgi:AraC-like DNA-binding protein|nr:AraC family transcriptional regulator [Oscillospiraceae bacterium]